MEGVRLFGLEEILSFAHEFFITFAIGNRVKGFSINPLIMQIIDNLSETFIKVFGWSNIGKQTDCDLVHIELLRGFLRAGNV